MHYMSKKHLDSNCSINTKNTIDKDQLESFAARREYLCIRYSKREKNKRRTCVLKETPKEKEQKLFSH